MRRRQIGSIEIDLMNIGGRHDVVVSGIRYVVALLPALHRGDGDLQLAGHRPDTAKGGDHPLRRALSAGRLCCPGRWLRRRQVRSLGCRAFFGVPGGCGGIGHMPGFGRRHVRRRVARLLAGGIGRDGWSVVVGAVFGLFRIGVHTGVGASVRSVSGNRWRGGWAQKTRAALHRRPAMRAYPAMSDG